MKKLTLPLVIGNWKMNPQTNEGAKRLATTLKKALTRVDGMVVVVAPPTPFLDVVKVALTDHKRVFLGAQNVHWEKLGAFTGEISLPMLESFSVKYIILGHSERRRAGESDEEINKKLKAVLKTEVTPIVCVGETTRDKSAHYLNIVENQVRSVVGGISKAKLERLVIAYEPVWAIGTGLTATAENVYEMRLFIEKILADAYGRTIARKVRILYGGSVTAQNANLLITEGNVDGFLVGGASLDAEEFSSIVKTVSAHTHT